MIPNDDRAALTVAEFCDRYRLSRSKFYDEVGDKRIKTRKLGRRTLVLIKDAEAWAAALPEGGAKP